MEAVHNESSHVPRGSPKLFVPGIINERGYCLDLRRSVYDTTSVLTVLMTEALKVTLAVMVWT